MKGMLPVRVTALAAHQIREAEASVYRRPTVCQPSPWLSKRAVISRYDQKSPMNDIQRKRIEKAIAAFMTKRRPPVHLRDQVDLSFRFDGRSVEIFSIRPRWNNPSERIEEAIAKARYLKSRGIWLVYWQRADLKWHKYGPVPEVRTIEAFLRLVDEDAYACFFG